MVLKVWLGKKKLGSGVSIFYQTSLLLLQGNQTSPKA